MRADSGGGGFYGIPLDGVVVVSMLAAGWAAGLLPMGHPVRVLVTFAVLFSVPGYALTLAVFPANGSVANDRRFRGLSSQAIGPPGVDFVERLALSFGLSVFLLPLFAFVLTLANLPYAYETVGGIVAVFSVLATGVGLVRRQRLDRNSRYDPSFATLRQSAPGSNRGGGSSLFLNITLAVAVILALGGLGLGLAAPPEGEQFTEVSLLTEDIDGELSASNYPTDLTRNETTELVLSVTNRERETVDYTVIVQLQGVDPDGTVTERATVRFLENEVGPGTTWRARHDLQLFRVGEDQRVAYLVYRGEPPANPTIASADRSVYFWTDVVPVSANS